MNSRFATKGKAKESSILPWLNIAAYVLMIVFNALAELLPINGVTTGEVSEAYPNLFAPADISFAIWGLIYFLLLVFVLCQAGLFKRYAPDRFLISRRIGILFILSSFFNIAWLFCWHYYRIPLSLLCMLGLLFVLALIYSRISGLKLFCRERLFAQLPFSVYFSWITVAAITNVSTALKSVQWDGFGLSEVVWTMVMLFAGLVISLCVILSKSDPAYGFVSVWAYLGIYIKHASADGFNGAYPIILKTSAICAVILLLASLVTLVSNIKKCRVSSKR